jgi:hypothetical protein
MCSGLKSKDGKDQKLGNTDVELYKSVKPRAKFQPSNKDLAEEAHWHVTKYKIKESSGKMPKLKNWKKQSLVDFLKKNPRQTEADIDFLVTNKALLFCMLCAAEAEKVDQDAAKKSRTWTGPEHWLRLYFALADDRAHQALLTKDDVLDQEALDARNHKQRPKTFKKLVAEIFNDPNFCPVTEVLPHMHGDFAQEIELPFDLMPGPITVDQVKCKVANVQAKLMHMIN